jgi:hypothetical protein
MKLLNVFLLLYVLSDIFSPFLPALTAVLLNLSDEHHILRHRDGNVYIIQAETTMGFEDIKFLRAQ